MGASCWSGRTPPCLFPFYPEVWGRSLQADGTPEGASLKLLDLQSIDPAGVAVDRDGNALVVTEGDGSTIDPGPATPSSSTARGNP